VIIVASFGTFATGLDTKNLYHIILAESIKAEITLRQAIGRGMRKLAGKTQVLIWDLVDGLAGYSVRHSKIREQIYREQKFEMERKIIDLTKKRPE
jgi:type I site-specific restriction endonuclease